MFILSGFIVRPTMWNADIELVTSYGLTSVLIFASYISASMHKILLCTCCLTVCLLPITAMTMMVFFHNYKLSNKGLIMACACVHFFLSLPFCLAVMMMFRFCMLCSQSVLCSQIVLFSLLVSLSKIGHRFRFIVRKET